MQGRIKSFPAWGRSAAAAAGWRKTRGKERGKGSSVRGADPPAAARLTALLRGASTADQ